MKKPKYPIGIQTFANIIEEGYIYVDKTGFIPSLVEYGKYIFLSRPRRFGKSLLLSTLHSYFNGERYLFQGLTIDSMDVDWTPRAVIHIDLNAENYMVDNGLELILDRILREYESKYEIIEKEISFSGRFIHLIRTIKERTGHRPVILVDEYDKPLLGIEDNPELFAKNQSILKSFFGVLKSMDGYIRFAMLTGVARFNKVSIFSDLNNLRDISISDEFADICGWTEEEVIANFSDGVENLAKRLEVSREEVLERLKVYYDGYLFSPGGSRLYNPFSVLNAVADGRLGRYWFQTGTPTFLVKRIKKARILLPSLNNARSLRADLETVGIDDANPIPLLFQTGYLTIKKASGDRYELQFPNKEVETGFAEQLLPLYAPQMKDLNGEFSLWEFQDELADGNPEAFMTRLQTMIKAVPYEQHNEKFYQNIVYLLFTLSGADSRVEEHTSKGRADLVVRTERYIYVFEFKYNGSAEEAIRQIRDRDYPGKFRLDPRPVFLIGANFSEKDRGLEKWIIESEIKRG
ncbi:MAG: ATP-binding protein [Muribaculaceae bacterium]|nr:ATP-binding protein [Muribaculaceae bacterium]